MGNKPLAIPEINATIETKDKQRFKIAYADLIDHILLLRQVIAYPEMTQDGPLLNYYIKEYCKRMGQQEIMTEQQQLKLPWPVEWIWHIHRLHPLAYDKDCRSFGSKKLVDKKAYNLIKNHGKKLHSEDAFESNRNALRFVPSINLVQAAINQRDFLEKFQQHWLYTHKVDKNDRFYFELLVQDYVSFLKLARKNEMVVPTFNIDLIWHSHMRHPVAYQTCCTALCGFVLDHDDSIEKSILSVNYQRTAARWKETYHVNYGQNVDPNKISSCAMVLTSNIRRNVSPSIDRSVNNARNDDVRTKPIGGDGGNCDTGGGSCDSGGGGCDGGGGSAGCGGAGCGGCGG